MQKLEIIIVHTSERNSVMEENEPKVTDDKLIV
jgi:hypothetical protein